MPEIRVNKYEVDQTATVYRDARYCGVVFCPTDSHADFIASPWHGAIAKASFPTLAGAVSYLVRER